MASIALSVEIAAPKRLVWELLSDLSSHSEWMKDAVSIDFATEQRRGVGVCMMVPTRVGPLRVTDRMEVNEWQEEESIGVRRLGRIGGQGRFELSSHPDGTTLTLSEEIDFPWYLGGRITGWFAGPILHRVFRANLFRFRDWVQTRQKGSR